MASLAPLQAAQPNIGLHSDAAVNSFFQNEIVSIQKRYQELQGDANDNTLFASLNTLLSELKQLHSLYSTNRSLSGLKKSRCLCCRKYTLSGPLAQINKLAKQIINQQLVIAVRSHKSLAIIKSLVRRGADVHQLIGDEKRNLLMIAAQHTNASAIKYFLKLGFNPRAQDAQGNTPLMLARGLFRDQLQPISTEGALSLSTFFVNNWLIFVDVVACFLSPEKRVLIQEMCSFSRVSLLAPGNTSFSLLKEKDEDGATPFFSCIEGLNSLGYTSSVMGWGPYGGIAVLLYFALCSLGLLWNKETFATFCTNYISPIAKCANFVSTVALVFLSNYPIFAAINLSLYSISLLDSKGYLPVPIQKVYYFGLHAIDASLHAFFSAIFRCFNLLTCSRC